jgi:prophage antirepressor-like protein
MSSGDSSLVPFAFEGRQVRVLTDEPWFVAADVCAALGVGNVSQALSRLHEDERTLISNEGQDLGGAPSLNLINEPGLYSLVLGSRKPEARRFKRWVTHEVLPAIRRSGRYAVPGVPSPIPVHQQDSVSALLLIGEAVARVPGVRAGIAMAATLTCIQENTGLAMDTLRRALPAAEEPLCSYNATRLGELLRLSARCTNLHLAEQGLRFRNGRGDWELTEAGRRWGEALPFCRNGRSGYQILWNPAVAEILQEEG